MRRKIFLIILIIFFVINLSALATLSYNRWLKPKPTPKPQDSLKSWRSLQRVMALSQAQMFRMRDLRGSLEQGIEEIRLQMVEKRKILLEEVQKPSPDLDLIDRTIDEISRFQGEIQKKTIRNLLEDKKILSPMQRDKYFSMFDNQGGDSSAGLGGGEEETDGLEVMTEVQSDSNVLKLIRRHS
jgi:hypothetical protein